MSDFKSYLSYTNLADGGVITTNVGMIRPISELKKPLFSGLARTEPLANPTDDWIIDIDLQEPRDIGLMGLLGCNYEPHPLEPVFAQASVSNTSDYSVLLETVEATLTESRESAQFAVNLYFPFSLNWSARYLRILTRWPVGAYTGDGSGSRDAGRVWAGPALIARAASIESEFGAESVSQTVRNSRGRVFVRAAKAGRTLATSIRGIPIADVIGPEPAFGSASAEWQSAQAQLASGAECVFVPTQRSQQRLNRLGLYATGESLRLNPQGRQLWQASARFNEILA